MFVTFYYFDKSKFVFNQVLQLNMFQTKGAVKTQYLSNTQDNPTLQC